MISFPFLYTTWSSQFVPWLVIHWFCRLTTVFTAQSHRRLSLRVQPRWRRPITAAPHPVSSMSHPCGTASVHAQITEPGRLNRVPQLAAFPSESRPPLRGAALLALSRAFPRHCPRSACDRLGAG